MYTFKCCTLERWWCSSDKKQDLYDSLQHLYHDKDMMICCDNDKIDLSHLNIGDRQYVVCETDERNHEDEIYIVLNVYRRVHKEPDRIWRSRYCDVLLE